MVKYFCPCLSLSDIFICFFCLFVYSFRQIIYNNHIIFQLKIIFQLAISNEGDAAVVGLAIANTILGGATGGMSVLFINYKISGKWSYLQTLNGALAGKNHIL